MKKIFLFILIFLTFNISVVNAFFVLPFSGMVKSAYSYANSNLNKTVIVKKYYLPGVTEEKTPKFSNIATSYKNALAEKRVAEAKARKIAKPGVALLEGKYIDINLTTQTLTTFQDGNVVYASKISSGASRTPTPTGTWKILNKSRKAWSARYKLYMPYWMAITPYGHGIHELPEYPNGYKEGAASIGRAVSHGCVRLPVGAAAIVYNWSNVGDTVYVHR